jgi:hypothetical protein
LDGDVSNNGRDGRDGSRLCVARDGLREDVDDGRGTDNEDDDDVEELEGPFSFNRFLYSNRLT